MDRVGNTTTPRKKLRRCRPDACKDRTLGGFGISRPTMMTHPVLNAYYGSLGQIENYWKSVYDPLKTSEVVREVLAETRRWKAGRDTRPTDHSIRDQTVQAEVRLRRDRQQDCRVARTSQRALRLAGHFRPLLIGIASGGHPGQQALLTCRGVSGRAFRRQSVQSGG
jgi:hypothetical protein